MNASRTIALAVLVGAGCVSPAPMPGPPRAAPGHDVDAHVEIAVPASEIYRTLTEGPGLARFAADRATTQPIEGGELALGFGSLSDGGEQVAARGMFLALIPPNRITFRIVYPPELWRARGVEVPDDQIVVHETDVVIHETGARSSDVSVTDRIDAIASPAYVAAVKRTWAEALANLKSVLEGGPDLRRKVRPPDE
ncbi:MAG: SRPBCC domain-containing protein [Planctomycetes bacterium]|nr:SRPBCC domain-containing protein [Planctomycetota bacterium]MBI3844106.1 SRPBCC domain-containing protein [Planctomycetota bacterium]